EWLDSCVSTHENCHSLSEEPALPTRVLDVGTTGDATDLRLLLSKGLQGRYAAASFCWGKIGILRTTQAVLNALVVRIPLEQLSQTFIDFITITRELGLRYIWIDALCIVQDSYEDWEKEAALLPHYFQNSFVNIVAASASDASQGFLASRSSSPLFTFHVHIPGDPRGGVLHLRKYLGLQDPVSAEPISSRGWVFQEQLLSPRNLYYTSREMTWECQQTAHRESFDASVSSYSPRLEIKKFIGEINTKTGNEADGPQEQEILDLWDSLVTMYSDKKVTYAPDRLLALESLARVFHKVLQDDYMAGMWRSGFPESMAWYRSGIHDSSKETHHIYIAPSWSWASDFGSTAYFFT
ncbi:HET-domain-containing protein, partial [Hyaloscypha hepaticicola]